MVKSPKRVALYVRVSMDGQTVENQRRDLNASAKRHGWQIVETFDDNGATDTRSRDERPGMRRLMEGVGRKDFDMVAAWSVDRLGRSLQDLIGFLSELQAKGVDLFLHKQGLDTSSSSGKAMFQMLGVFSEFERAMIQERVRAGLARARARGKKLGRPPVPPDTEKAIRKSLAAGNGILKTAATVGVGSSTVQRVKAALQEAPGRA
jgi:DNA invertase Pin-like site-specific DNA recombinase